MNAVVYVMALFRRKPQPIPYASRSDFQAAVERQRMARSRHAKGCNAVPEFTLAELQRELGQ